MNASSLPKVELHAHLSGSISSATLLSLIDQRRQHVIGIKPEVVELLTLEAGHTRTLEECFQIFPIIQSIVDSEHALRTVVRSVLCDFQRDNVVYLELRTTPREIRGVITRREWVEIILDEIDKFHTDNPDGMVCRLILSIDRSKPVAVAECVRRIIQEMYAESDLIVGVELSGNPTKGEWSAFEHVFRAIRSNSNMNGNIPIALHFGEVLNEAEALQMLQFKPDRVGHAVCITKKTRELLLGSRIPIEICLTSNQITKSIPENNSMENHPVFTAYHPSNHPFTLCTDDMGIFRTTLSEQWNIFLKHTAPHMTPGEYALHFTASLNQSFCSDETVLAELRKKIDIWLRNENK